MWGVRSCPVSFCKGTVCLLHQCEGTVWVVGVGGIAAYAPCMLTKVLPLLVEQ